MATIGPFAYAPGSALLPVLMPVDLTDGFGGEGAGWLAPSSPFGNYVVWSFFDAAPGDPPGTRSIQLGNATAGDRNVTYWILQVGP